MPTRKELEAAADACARQASISRQRMRDHQKLGQYGGASAAQGRATESERASQRLNRRAAETPRD